MENVPLFPRPPISMKAGIGHVATERMSGVEGEADPLGHKPMTAFDPGCVNVWPAPSARV
jgi:hypothetical protein